MKKIILLFAALIFTFFAKAQLNWSNQSALTLEKGRKEIALFGPAKIGLKDSLELSIHPVLFFVIPHVGIKKYWKSIGSIDIASKHNITYPTMLYRLLSRRGTGGVLPATSKIPHLLKFNNAVLIGKTFSEHFTATMNLGVDLTIPLGGEKHFPEIEYYFAYPRTYSFNNVIMPYFAAALTGKITRRLQYGYTFNSFFLTKSYKGTIMENNLQIHWSKSDKFAVRGGFVSTYGRFPYGVDGRFFPVIDFLFGF